MKKYKLKNLGYARTTTSAMVRVKFSNGEQFDVPVQIIADSRDENYKDEKEDTVKFIRAGSLDSYEIKDWLSNNMNWSDVAEYAFKIPYSPRPFDYEGDFTNCDKEIAGKI